MRGFISFLREQGVVGLAIGFILGGAISKVVAALVNDIVNPILGGFLKETETLKDAKFAVGSSEVLWGDLVVVIIDFVILAAVVYFIFKGLGIDKLDKKKT